MSDLLSRAWQGEESYQGAWSGGSLRSSGDVRSIPSSQNEPSKFIHSQHHAAEFKALTDQIERLLNLEANWDGEGARVVTAAALAMAQQVANFASAWPTSPQMVPTNEGGISVETHTLRGDISIDISSTGTVELFFLDASTGLSKDGPITAMLEDHGDSVVAIIVG